MADRAADHVTCGLCRFKLSSNCLNAQEEGDSEIIMRTNALKRGVLTLPGTGFLTNGRKTSYVRASFSLLSRDRVEEAARRLRQAILDAREAATASEVLRI